MKRKVGRRGREIARDVQPGDSSVPARTCPEDLQYFVLACNIRTIASIPWDNEPSGCARVPSAIVDSLSGLVIICKASWYYIINAIDSRSRFTRRIVRWTLSKSIHDPLNIDTRNRTFKNCLSSSKICKHHMWRCKFMLAIRSMRSFFPAIA